MAELNAMLLAAKSGGAARLPDAAVAETPESQGDGESAPQAPARIYAPEEQRCGLIAIVGKPNVGKSTLMNALVGQKISITSRKAQTTRHRITGIRTREETQFVFVDTPGFQTKHSTALNKSLNKTVMGAIGDVDLILFVVEAGSFTLGDAKVLSLFKPGIPTLLIANKLDRVHRRGDIAPWLRDMQERHPFTEFVPMSAKKRDDIQRLLGICAPYLPQQPWFYGADELTDRSEKFLASETVREKLFRFTGDELPYTSTVVIDKFDEEPSPKFGRFMRIAATIVVERDGHKAMVIGAGGERLKMISTEARQELEKLLNAKVFLEVWVKVRSGWADDAARVKSFGYE
ncbi:MAG: GTPase Era [Comamonas sp.]|nr:GTPase Era [Comamonas sp.]HRL38158.1 GTPase Era [Comamonas denitrificans]MBP6293519.1 GTPase Era [Comamonas sp.]MBP7931978.1 GTPase Era [Comamonas sp.]MBP7940592.1 GTPase Era [Comamonas sp.]